MKVKHLMWDESTLDHIARHNVMIEEIVELKDSDYLVKKTKQGRYIMLGQTYSGRYLTVILAPLGKGNFEVITAREMNEAERKYYRKRGK